jgi:hypothetical protein
MKARIALAGLATASLFAVGVAEASANYAQTVLQDNPRHYWRMDDGNATMLDSSSDAQKKNGSHIGTSRVSGVLSGASSFSMRYHGDTGPNSRSEVDQSETYDAFSVEFWIRTTDSANTVNHWWQGKGLVDSDSPVGGDDDFGVSLANGGKVAVGVGSDPPGADPTRFSVKSVNDGQWHHVVAQYNVSSLLIYVDGELDGTQSVNPTDITRSISGFTIGAIRTGGGRVSADLDEVAIYPNAFPPERVAAHYNAGRASADADNDGVPDASDFCPNQRGPASLGGCPDTDGDGLIDQNDTCPGEAGPTSSSTANGCPLGELVVYPAGAGRGNIYGPGLECIDVGIFMGGSGTCRTAFDDAPRAVELRAEPQAESRFNHFEFSIIGESGVATCGAECQAVAIPGRTTEMRAIFHKLPVPLAKTVDETLGQGAAALDKALRPVVSQGKKPSNPSVLLSGADLGTNARILIGAELVGPDGSSAVPEAPSLKKVLAGLVGPDGSSLVGPDGSSLIGMDGSSLVGPDGSSLVGPDGSSLIGTDGSSLVGPDGSSLVGNNGNARSGLTAERAKPGKKPKLKLYALGTAVRSTTGAGSVQTTMSLTDPGRKFLSRVGDANAKRKKPKELPVGLLEIMVPQDDQGGAIAYESFKIG